jgi:hypothetical protein
MLSGLLESNPGLEVTPQVLLQFIAQRTHGSPDGSPLPDDDERGRQDDRDAYPGSSRSSSRDSAHTAYRGSGRPPSRGPSVPQTPTHANSPFDSSRRQRSTPLARAAPSSWARRPMPPTRRLSDASSSGPMASDSEVISTCPHVVTMLSNARLAYQSIVLRPSRPPYVERWSTTSDRVRFRAHLHHPFPLRLETAVSYPFPPSLKGTKSASGPFHAYGIPRQLQSWGSITFTGR